MYFQNTNDQMKFTEERAPPQNKAKQNSFLWIDVNEVYNKKSSERTPTI